MSTNAPAGGDSTSTDTPGIRASATFNGIMVLLLGSLVFFSTLGEDGLSGTNGAIVFVSSIVVAVALFALAGIFVLMMDIEENTRSSFRMQQRMLELTEPKRPAPDAAAAEVDAVPVEAPVPPAAAH